jgi:hypothetical protein
VDILVKHIHSCYANQTLFWVPMDTQDRYNKNLKENFELLKHFDWIDKTIEYKFNSLGFRSIEFDHTPNIIFVGCSNTQGIGIRQEDRWTELVASSLNLSCFNLGVGGTSADTAFRLLYVYIDKLRPKLVIFREPPGIRIELLYEDNFLDLHVRSEMPPKIRDYFLDYYASNDINHNLNLLKNINAMENLSIKHGSKFLFTKEKKSIDFARDLTHPGISSNQKYAEYVLSLI